MDTSQRHIERVDLERIKETDLKRIEEVDTRTQSHQAQGYKVSQATFGSG